MTTAIPRFRMTPIPFQFPLQRLKPLLLLSLLQVCMVPAAGRAALLTPVQQDSPSQLRMERAVLLAQAAGSSRAGLSDSSGLNSQAQESFEKGDYPGAIALWTQLILTQSSAAVRNDALISRAKAYLVINQPTLALADLGVVDFPLSQTADLANLWLLRGTTLLQLKRYDEAVKAFNTSQRLAAPSSILLSNRAVALQSLGKLAEARKDLLASIALEPILSSYYNLAVLDRLSGNYPACIDLLTQIIKKSSTYAPAYLQRGLCSAALRRQDDAAADMLRVLKLDPGNVEAIEQLGYSLAAAGKADAARAYLLKASSIRLAQGQVDQYQQLLKVIAGLDRR